MVVSILLRIVGLHRVSQWVVARSFKYSMIAAAGVRFKIIGGQEHLQTRPAVFIGNHQTALDVLFLGEIFPKYCSVTAKKQLKNVPFLGWFMALSGTVFIDRANRKTAMQAMEGAAQEIRNKKQSVFIFPEGTRSNASEPTLLPFKKGAFHLAIQAKVPIVPVVSACYWGVLSVKEWRFRRGEIPVIVLPPIDTSNLDPSDVDELVKYTRDKMLKALTLLTNSTRGQQAFLAIPPPPPAEAPAQASQDAATTETVLGGVANGSNIADGDTGVRQRLVPGKDDLQSQEPQRTFDEKVQ